jgi:hypothetical protein
MEGQSFNSCKTTRTTTSTVILPLSADPDVSVYINPITGQKKLRRRRPQSLRASPNCNGGGCQGLCKAGMIFEGLRPMINKQVPSGLYAIGMIQCPECRVFYYPEQAKNMSEKTKKTKQDRCPCCFTRLRHRPLHKTGAKYLVDDTNRRGY